MLKRLMVKSLFLALICSVSFVAHAMADSPKPIDIPAGSLVPALEALQKQAAVELVYQAEQLKSFRTSGVKGTYTARDAVMLLLKGTPLELRTDPSGAMLIAPPKANTTSTDPQPTGGDNAVKEGKKDSSSAFLLAQVDQGHASDTSTVEQPEEKAKRHKDADVHLPEILIIGSRALNMDIKRSRDDPQPYVIFDRTEIQQSGADNLEDFLKNRLPMNTQYVTNTQFSASTGGTSSQSRINLRGLGSEQTLVLIDGHRSTGVREDDLNNASQPNINGIPLAAVERIEVLPTTASGIYGGSATGGVINVVLRHDYSGAEAKLTYGNIFGANSAERSLDVSSGFNLEGGKTNVLIAASYSDADPLTYQERAGLIRRGLAQLLANNSNNYQALDLFGAFPPLGSTPNIASADGSNLVLKNGTALNSPITFVPPGYPGTAGDGGAALAANAGKYNLDLAHSAQEYGTGSDLSLLNPPKVEALMVTLRRDFTPRVQGFLEGSGSNTIVTNRFGAAAFIGEVLGDFTLPVSSPNNPFQQPIVVTVPTASTDGVARSESYDRRLVGGLIVKLARDWESEGDFTWSQFRTWSEGPPIFPTAALGAAVSTGAINVMRDTGSYPVDLSRYVDQTTGSSTPESFRSTLKDATLRFAGPLGSLPAGRPNATVLFEHRDETLSDGIINTGFGSLLFPERSQSVASAYMELRAPLVSERNKISTVRELELQLSGRWDDYTTHGNNGPLAINPDGSTAPIIRATNKFTSINPTLALRYVPIPDLTLRASYGTGFLPPSVTQLVPQPPSPSLLSTITDPRRGNTPVGLTTVQQGGNPNLVPEDSKSTSAGVILTPRVLPGARLSVDYTKIEKTHDISTFPGTVPGYYGSIQSLINNESSFPTRITRGPNLPGDQPGWAGPISFINLTLFNIAKAEVEAYDAQLDYKRESDRFGAFDFAALATWEMHYRTQALAGFPVQENVGITSINPLKFKANASLTWNYRHWTLGWITRYFDSYWVNGTHTFDVNQGSATVPSQIYHDAFATYRFDRVSSSGFGSQLLSNMEISLGVRDVFNTKPPFEYNANVNGQFGLYSYFGDPRLASYYLSVRTHF